MGDDVKVKVETYLASSPKALSDALAGQLKGQRKYRYGKHRVIFIIYESTKEIEVIKVKHRSKSYIN